MKRIGIFLTSEAYIDLAKLLQKELCEVLSSNEITIYHKGKLDGCEYVKSLPEATTKAFNNSDALIYIGAMGICIRCIAPMVEDKHTDPAVVCLDSTGKHIVSVLSGHIGGANKLTRLIATITGGEAVITTQSDNTGMWALDTLAADHGWTCDASSSKMNAAIYAFVKGKRTALILESDDKGADYLRSTKPHNVTIYPTYEAYLAALDGKGERESYDLLIAVSPRILPKSSALNIQYYPRTLHLGVGCKKLADKKIANQILEEITSAAYATQSIASIGSIDLKKDEPALAELHRLCPWAKMIFYTAEELNKVDIPNPSDKVFAVTGTYGVAEAAALSSEKDAVLVIPKRKGHIEGESDSCYTFALAVSHYESRGGHIEIVGAGPGDPDLISVRGRRFLEKADLILYAGSLVPRELTTCAKEGATVRSSASMALEEQLQLMKEFYDKGQLVVRLHTGDPCIYGAIQEQMNFFDANGMQYHITPGISSFQAAAAELKSQFTIPEKVQTIILTRGEGRTPMPEKEKLHLLARSQSTMCIFLSAGIAKEVQDELLECYPPDTPVAACYKLTWKEQRIYRGRLCELADIIKNNHLTLTTMIVVGESIDNRKGLSKLYDSHFTHLFRKGKDD